MDIYTKIYVSSYDLTNGSYPLGQCPVAGKASLDVTLYNTIYNIPSQTYYEFKGSGVFSTMVVPQGQYSLASLLATMKASMITSVPDCDIYMDPILRKMVISSPTVAATAIPLTLYTVTPKSI